MKNGTWEGLCLAKMRPLGVTFRGQMQPLERTFAGCNAPLERTYRLIRGALPPLRRKAALKVVRAISRPGGARMGHPRPQRKIHIAIKRIELLIHRRSLRIRLDRAQRQTHRGLRLFNRLVSPAASSAKIPIPGSLERPPAPAPACSTHWHTCGSALRSSAESRPR
jgi:hypothetical protein